VVELYDKGKDDEAEQLEESIHGGGVETITKAAIARAPETKPVKIAGASTTFKWCWKLVDGDKLKPEYTKIIVDVTVIETTVKRFGIDAGSMVGDGAIEVWQEANTRSTGR